MSIDVEGTADRSPEWSATVNSEQFAHMGERVNAPEREAIQISRPVTYGNGSRVELIEDGHRPTLFSDAAVHSDNETKTVELTSDGIETLVPCGRALARGRPYHIWGTLSESLSCGPKHHQYA